MEEDALQVWLRRSPGIAMVLAVAGYLVYVGASFGLNNPGRPKTRLAIQQKLLEFAGQHQSPEEIYGKALDSLKKVHPKMVPVLVDSLSEKGAREIELHQAYAISKEKPPEGGSADVEIFKRDAEQDPALSILGMRLTSADEKLVLFTPGIRYCAIAASARTVDEVVRSYIDQLTRNEWVFSRAIYEPERNVAEFSAIQGPWRLSLLIWGHSYVPDHPTTIHWEVSKGRSLDEEETEQ